MLELNLSSKATTVQVNSNLHIISITCSGSTIARMCGIAGHGKGEVDHVGDVAKVAVRRQIARGEVFLRSKNIVEFLRNEFGKKTSPPYHIVEIEEKPLEEEQKRCPHLQGDQKNVPPLPGPSIAFSNTTYLKMKKYTSKRSI